MKRKRPVPGVDGSVEGPRLSYPRPEPIWTKVLVFGRRTCQGCRLLRRLARDLHLDLDERDLDRRPEHRDELRRRLEQNGVRDVAAALETSPHVFWVDAFVQPQSVLRIHYIPGGYCGLRSYLFGERCACLSSGGPD